MAAFCDAVIPAPCDPTDDVLVLAEVQRPMTDTIDRLSREYRDHAINWQAADSTNAKIGETFTRRELMPLLSQHVAAIGST